jgi:hypothetical protein
MTVQGSLRLCESLRTLRETSLTQMTFRAKSLRTAKTQI